MRLASCEAVFWLKLLIESGLSDRSEIAWELDEAEQLVRLYDAPTDRIELVPPGVIHAYFSPGDRAGARRALHLDAGTSPVLRASTAHAAASVPPALSPPSAMRAGSAPSRCASAKIQCRTSKASLTAVGKRHCGPSR